jgi:hypothetical protein
MGSILDEPLERAILATEGVTLSGKRTGDRASNVALSFCIAKSFEGQIIYLSFVLFTNV